MRALPSSIRRCLQPNRVCNADGKRETAEDGLPHVKADHLAQAPKDARRSMPSIGLLQELGFNGAEPGVLVALSARVSVPSLHRFTQN